MCVFLCCLPLSLLHIHTHTTHSLSGASFGSDTSDLLNPQEGFVFQEDLGAPHMELPVSWSPPTIHTPYVTTTHTVYPIYVILQLEAQMDTTESSQLSEIFSILEGDPTGTYDR